VLAAVELALEVGAPTKTHILNLLHRLVDGTLADFKASSAPEIDGAILDPSSRTEVSAGASINKARDCVAPQPAEPDPPRDRIELVRLQSRKFTPVSGRPRIEALRQYSTAYDEKRKTFADTPHCDWTTDIADTAPTARS